MCKQKGGLGNTLTAKAAADIEISSSQIIVAVYKSRAVREGAMKMILPADRAVGDDSPLDGECLLPARSPARRLSSLLRREFSLRQIFFVGLGGFIGAILRYLISGWVQSLSKSIDFPYGTLAVNVLGCLIIGLLSQLAAARGLFGPDSRALIFIGVLGAFTTFSTFSGETLNLIFDGNHLLALANIGLQLSLCLGAVWLGYALAYQIWR
jgi:CrcB protein